MRNKWEERSKVIDQFEVKVLKMKNGFDEKEKTLQNEKNQLLETLRYDACFFPLQFRQEAIRRRNVSFGWEIGR